MKGFTAEYRTVFSLQVGWRFLTFVSATMELVPIIDLTDLGRLGLLIQHPTSVFYQFDTFGTQHKVKIIEGAFFPFDDPDSEIQGELMDLFKAENMGKKRPSPISLDIAGDIDRILMSSAKGLAGSFRETFFLETDKSKLETSSQAWVHVIIKKMPELPTWIDPESVSEIRETWLDKMKSYLEIQKRHIIQDRNHPALEKEATFYPLSGFKNAKGVLVWANYNGH